MRARLGALALVLLTSSCGVPLKERGEELANACSSDDDCGSTGVCREDRCVSTRASLPGLLLQIDLPAQSPYGAGTSSLVAVADDGVALQGRNDGGFSVSYDLAVPELVSISNVRLQVSPVPPGCVAAEGDGSIPVSVQLHPAGQPVGLPLTVYSSRSTLVAEDEGEVYRCALQVPAGTYDIYVTVDADASGADPEEGCALPPVLLTGHQLDTSNVSVDLSVGEPTVLTGSIIGLSDTLHLTGWTLELVENKNGRPISTPWTFERRAGISPPGGFAVSYWPELAEQAVIRLSPPDDADAIPTVLWLLDAVDLDGDQHVGLDLTALATATPVQIEGSVLDEDAGTGVGATVTIQSHELLGGEFGANAAYRTTSDAGSTGRFDVALLPGTYKVIAQPGGAPDQAVTEASWKINQNDLGGGKTIVLHPKTSMVGTVQTAGGDPAFDVPAYLQPSATPPLPYLDDVLSTYDVLPTNATALTDTEGVFAIPVDPGAFDLSIRPSDTSGFPWLVRARVTIQPSTEPATADLGALVVSNPVALTGAVVSPTGQRLGGAVIRAWVPVQDEAGEQAQSTVIQIGHAISDAAGSYSLLLPASISQ
ncbi:MAG: carboxypeptidase regulatory-like domain-containing protein [Deltaproteobacteria bacterium]|jgi:hypothetical protein|nr:carboxypeptidase regulatory-like domain-containing protein [Deltaproteobacteria bacterium]MBW2530960.1 carboxypeptidase regulatory-like domain-containing protein [Deltaproteobacteria bacterium]